MLLMLDFHPTYSVTGIDLASGQPSFPVLVDPVGWQTRAGDPLNQGFVAGNRAFPVRTTLRRAISNPPNDAPNPATSFPRQAPYRPGPSIPPLVSWNYPFYPQAGGAPNPYNPAGRPDPYQSLDFRANIRLTSLLDDITFDGSGEASAATNQLERAGRYSAAWLIQRSRNDVPTDVDVKVLVFAGRSVTATPSAETSYTATTSPGTKTIVMTLGGQAAPRLRRGAWVAFVLPIPPTPQTTEVAYPAMDFYRVVGVNDDLPDTLVLEVETPIKRQSPTAMGAGGNYNGAVVVFDNLFEVFDRGTITPLATTTK
jgi:hypothetical protein